MKPLAQSAPAVIKHEQLKMLLENNSVIGITIDASQAGYGITASTVSGPKILHTKTGKIRLFKTMETLLSYLKRDMGIAKASIQFERWQPEQSLLL